MKIGTKHTPVQHLTIDRYMNIVETKKNQPVLISLIIQQIFI